jgi:hypothetical protein
MFTRAMSLCLLGLLPLLGLAADAPPRAKDAPPKTDAESGRWDALHKQLAEIRDGVAELRHRRDTDDKARAIEMDVLKDRLDKIEKALEGLKGSTRISSSFTPGTAPATGTVRIENRSGVGATVVLNGRTYSLAPLQTITLAPQPAGNFTYSVGADGFGEIRAPTTRVLGAGETFSIAINP